VPQLVKTDLPPPFMKSGISLPQQQQLVTWLS